MKGLMRALTSFVVSFLPSNDNIWVFTSRPNEFSENSKYQFLYSSRQAHVRAIWISQNESLVSSLREEGYEAYLYQSFTGKFFILRSGYVFLTHGWNLRPYSGNSTIVQLWHGNMVKKMGNDNKSNSPFRNLYYRIFGRDWDYFVVTSSSYPARHAQSAYGLKKEELLVAGYPRTDVFLRDVPDAMVGINPDIRKAFKAARVEGPLLCFFPTWNGGRDDQTRFSEEDVCLESLDRLLDSFNAQLIIKQHPYSQTLIDDSELKNILVIPESMDVYPLLDHIDVLITDYSSIFFDYLLLDNPIIFYPYDLQTYVRKRDLYFEYLKFIPGPKAFTPKELNETIESLLREGDYYQKQRNQLRNEFFAFQDGNACERIHNFITNKYE